MNNIESDTAKEISQILSNLYECKTPEEEIVKFICEKVY